MEEVMRPRHSTNGRRAGLATALAIAGLAQATRGQGLERELLIPTVGSSTQRFGYGLAAQDGVLVVGCPFEDTMASNAGAACVYRWDPTTETWLLEQQLFASDAESGAQFGAAVGIDGDVLVVGANLEDNTKGTDAGAVYVFRYDSSTATWSEEQKLLAGVGTGTDQFGAAVAVSGDAFIVGAPLSDTAAGADAGSAYVFRYKGGFVKWAEELRLIDPDGTKGDQAGFSVDIEGDRAVVSSHLSDDNALKDSGTVGIWEYAASTWTQTAEIFQGTPAADSSFGQAVALDGDVIAVGAPQEDANTTATDSGGAYVFRLIAGTWTQELWLPAPAPSKNGNFGIAIDVEGKVAAIGSNLDDSSGKSDSGMNWTARRGKNGAWVLDQQLGASDANTTDKLGSRIAMTTTQILSAADLNDTTLGTDAGAVYVYPSAEIVTDITPSTPAAGAKITFSSFYGTPGDPILLTIEDIDGAPTFFPLVMFVFASDRLFTFDAFAPNPLYGLTIGLRSYKISETGPIVFSELEYVDV
jgi:hypothetical protein